MKYEDVVKARALKDIIDDLGCLEDDINNILSHTYLLDKRDFDSVFKKIELLRNNRIKELEDL